MNSPALRRIQLENFKAVQNSKSIRLTPLTVFIGNNGSGKSSLIEGLYTYQMIIQQGLDVAMNYWRGFEYIRNRALSHKLQFNTISSQPGSGLLGCRKQSSSCARCDSRRGC